MLTSHNLKSSPLANDRGFIVALPMWLLSCLISSVAVSPYVLVRAIGACQEQTAEHSVKAQADSAYQEALALLEKGATPDALKKFKQSHELYVRARDQRGEADALRNMGRVCSSMGRECKDDASGYLNQALALYRSLADKAGEGVTLVHIGIVQRKTGDVTGALKLFEEALPILPEAWLRDNGGVLLNTMADDYRASGDPQKSYETYKRALRHWQMQMDEGEIASTAEILGILYLMDGDKVNSLEYLRQAQQSWHRLKNLKREAGTLESLGILSGQLGDHARQVAYYNQALTMFQEAKLQPEEVEVLNLMGVFYRWIGDPQRALSYHQQALRISAEIKDPKAQAESNRQIAQTYRSMGDYLSGRGPLQAALDLFKSLNKTEDMASVLFDLGLVYDSAGEYQQAINFLNQSVIYSRAAKNAVAELSALRQIGGIYIRQGERQKALENLAEQVSLSKLVTEPEVKAVMLGMIAINYSLLREDRETINYYRQALELYRATGNKRGISEALAGMGAAHEFLGDFQQALSLYRESISVREEMRTAVHLEDLKAGIAGQNASTYQYAARLYMRLNQPVEAFELSERARARNLLDQLGNTRINPLKDADPQLVKREQSLRAELAALERRYARESSGPTPDIGDSRPQTSKSAQEISSLEHRYDAVLTQLKANNSEYVSMRTVNPLTLAEVQKLLDKETTLVSYFITTDQTQAFVITRDSFRAVTLPVKEQSLYDAVSTFRGFADSKSPHPQSLQKLYGWLIEPLKPYLKTPLVGIVPHGILYYLPFAALTDGRRYFGDEHKLFVLPSASVLPFLQQKQKLGRASLLSISQSQAEGAAVLTYADRTATEVARLFNTTALTGGAATETAFRARAGSSSIIFVAAHGHLSTANPLFSRILLTPDQAHDGMLEVHEVYGLDLEKADLVVLSGCQTQLGSQSRGDDIVGLNRAFIYAGTPTVIASLWSVREQPTSELMIAFFKNLKKGMSKVAALQAAQAQVREKNPNPYYWAAFVLTGDPQ
jgi:CHAT domain-containing protein